MLSLRAMKQLLLICVSVALVGCETKEEVDAGGGLSAGKNSNSTGPSAELLKIKSKAEIGDAESQFKLALMYGKGVGTTKNNQEAVKWLRKAAEQGLVDAQFTLGTLYDNGNGVQKNPKKAADWYLKSAEGGFVNAQFTVGMVYRLGKGVRQSNSEAVKWLRKAADQGHSIAMENLKVILEEDPHLREE